MTYLNDFKKEFNLLVETSTHNIYYIHISLCSYNNKLVNNYSPNKIIKQNYFLDS